jgi:hypothetical protein
MARRFDAATTCCFCNIYGHKHYHCYDGNIAGHWKDLLASLDCFSRYGQRAVAKNHAVVRTWPHDISGSNGTYFLDRLLHFTILDSFHSYSIGQANIL